MFRRSALLATLVAIAVAVSGCFFAAARLSKIELSSTASSVEQGKSVTLTAKGLDQRDKEISISNPQWSLDDASKGTLTKDGSKATFTAGANATGKVKVTVSSGNVSASVEITITAAPDPGGDDDDDDKEPGDDDDDKEPGDDDDKEPGDDDDPLGTAIANALALKDATGAGAGFNEAPVFAHFAFEQAIDEAISVRDDDDATEEEIDAAIEALEDAVSEFESQIIAFPIPVKVHEFVIDADNEGKVAGYSITRADLELNTDPRFIVDGDYSAKAIPDGQPAEFRIRDYHDNWNPDWREYEYLAFWIYIEDLSYLRDNPAIRIASPYGNAGNRMALVRADFQAGWNSFMLSLRDDLGLTEAELEDMDPFELRVDITPREDNSRDAYYVDAVRLVDLGGAPAKPPVDKTNLEAKIDEAEDLKANTGEGNAPGEAPAAAHTALQNAIDAAKAVLNDDDATQGDVDAAVVALDAAIAAFNAAIITAPPVDKSALADAIDEAEDLKANTGEGNAPGEAPAAAHAALQNAIDAAKAVLNDDDATQDEVDDAVNALNAAIADFEDAIVDETVSPLPLIEEFEAANIDEFLTAEYKSLPDDPNAPMYIRRTGSNSMIISGGVLDLVGGQFSIGKRTATLTTKDDEEVDGIFDFTKPYRITLEVVGADTKGNLQVYVDNNTTSSGESMHGGKSRVYSKSLTEVGDLITNEGGMTKVIVTPDFGTETSFVSVRTDGGGSAKIQKIIIEHL